MEWHLWNVKIINIENTSVKETKTKKPTLICFAQGILMGVAWVLNNYQHLTYAINV